MKLKYVTREEIGGRGYEVTKLMKIIQEFVNSDHDFAMLELEEGEYRNVKSAYSSVYAAIMRFKYPVRVRSIKGKLYIEKI